MKPIILYTEEIMSSVPFSDFENFNPLSIFEVARKLAAEKFGSVLDVASMNGESFGVLLKTGSVQGREFLSACKNNPSFAPQLLEILKLRYIVISDAITPGIIELTGHSDALGGLCMVKIIG